MRQRSAFTLIELLVVVAIIALLVAILLPSLNEARGIAEQVVCGHNTKQWGLAFALYDHDNGGLPSFCHDQNISAGGSGSDIHYVLGPYLGYNWEDYYDRAARDWIYPRTTPEMFKCPSIPDRLWAYGWNYPNVIAYLPFTPFPATHNRVEFRKPFSLDEIPRPSQTLLLGDSETAWYSPFGPLPYSPDLDYDGDGLPASNSGYDTNKALFDYVTANRGYDVPYNGIAPRHVNGLVNCAFLDGHSETMKVYDMMDPDRRLWGEDLWK